MLDRLLGELQRSFAADEILPAATQLVLVDHLGASRALVIEFPHSADWPRVGELLQFIEHELDWPRPALSISATGAFSVWLSFASLRSRQQQEILWTGLRNRCLADLPAERVCCHPLDGVFSVPIVPAYDAAAERWSAFIDPGMGSMFVTEGGLEFEPNPERQAEMLAGLNAVAERDIGRAMAGLAIDQPSMTAPTASVLGQFSDPADFLLAVMNDVSLPIGERIRAASALLAGRQS